VRDRTRLVRDIGERQSARGAVEREWFEGWQAEYDEVAADGDEEMCALLVDILVAFDRWSANAATDGVHGSS
jgi:hypothetical protein